MRRRGIAREKLAGACQGSGPALELQQRFDRENLALLNEHSAWIRLGMLLRPSERVGALTSLERRLGLGQQRQLGFRVGHCRHHNGGRLAA